MAEGFMLHKCKEMGRHDLTVSSMGIHGLNDFPATEYAQKVCEKDGSRAAKLPSKTRGLRKSLYFYA